MAGVANVLTAPPAAAGRPPASAAADGTAFDRVLAGEVAASGRTVRDGARHERGERGEDGEPAAICVPAGTGAADPAVTADGAAVVIVATTAPTAFGVAESGTWTAAEAEAEAVPVVGPGAVPARPEGAWSGANGTTPEPAPQPAAAGSGGQTVTARVADEPAAPDAAVPAPAAAARGRHPAAVTGRQPAPTPPAPEGAAPAAAEPETADPASAAAPARGAEAAARPAEMLAHAPTARGAERVVTSSAPPQEAPAPRTVAEQLGARLTAVRGLGAGRHVLSVPLDPERLGSVRVVAHITADAVRVDLVGATDASRDALRAALGDLRRDLASAGLNVDLGLGDSQESRQESGSHPEPGWEPRPETPKGAPAPDQSTPARATRGLDLLA